MAQLNVALYEQLARYFARCLNQLADANSYIHEAEVAVADLTTSNYVPYTGVGAADANAAIDVTINLLTAMNAAYNGVTNMVASNGSLIIAVRALNDYVVANATAAEISAASTAGLDVLTYYVNREVLWEVDEYTLAVPNEWKTICTQAGYNTTLWVLDEVAGS